MNIASFFTGGVAEVADSVGEGLDNLFTSDEERITANRVLQEVKNKAKEKKDEFAILFEKEVTARWLSDKDGIITRNVRPLSYAYVLFIFGVIVLADGNVGEFKVNALYIPVIETLLGIMTISYFGSRGLEKIAKFRGKKDATA